MAKRPAKERSNLIAQVTTPLAFFTLGVLVIEVILGSLSFRADDAQLTILIVGVLVGFALLCSMVFFLASNPARRHLLLGTEPTIPPATLIHSMQLSRNDIRVLYTISMSGRTLDVDEADAAVLGDKPMPNERRFEKLTKLGLLELVDQHDDSHDFWPPVQYQATDEGFALVYLMHNIVDAVDELRASMKEK